MAKDWIDPSEAARMINNMDPGYFRRRFVCPDTRDNWELVVRQFHGPKGQARYKILFISVVTYLQTHTVMGDNKNKVS